MYIPVINRFTCNPKQLYNYIHWIKSLKMIPIIDPINENPNLSETNYYNISKTIENYPNNYFAIKLSSLGINNNIDLAENRIHSLVNQAITNNSYIFIDAEEFTINDFIDKIANNLMMEYNTHKVNLYKTYQMYRKDTMKKFLNDLKSDRNYYMGCKLVRGAYYSQDKKYDILFRNIEHTHKSYNDAIKYYSYYSKKNDKLVCASHNPLSNQLALKYSKDSNISVGHLLGMSDNLSKLQVQNNIKVFKYLPYGYFSESLPYLSRRLYENYSILRYLF